MSQPRLQLLSTDHPAARDDAELVAELVHRAGRAEGRARLERGEARTCWIRAGLILLGHKGEHGFRARTGLTERQSETARSYARAWEVSGRLGGEEAPLVPDSWDDLRDRDIQLLGRKFPLGGDVRLPMLGSTPALSITTPTSRSMCSSTTVADTTDGVPVVEVADGRAHLLYGVDVLQGLSTFGDGSIDMVGTSWPWPCSSIDYGHPDQYGREGSIEAAIERIGPVSRELFRVLSDTGSVWLEYGDETTSGGPRFLDIEAARAFSEAAPWVLVQRCTRVTTNPKPCSGSGPMIPATSSIFLFQKSGHKAFFDPLGLEGMAGRETIRSRIREGWDDDEARDTPTWAWNVFFTPRTCHHAHPHPAPFSPKLADSWIKLSCPPGGTVLDPFSGSGSTGMAALSSGRLYIGIDIQLDYLDLAVRNLEQAAKR